MTWPNLLYRQADQLIKPHGFDILGIGISKHKMNRTGKVEWTGITATPELTEMRFLL